MKTKENTNAKENINACSPSPSRKFPEDRCRSSPGSWRKPRKRSSERRPSCHPA